ncbi:hypothetical protein [Arundinibacter roseus]|nr:hypothetical protein [Arundinibacter roseus]
MKVLPKKKKRTNSEEGIQESNPLDPITRKVALALVFVSVFVFFFKIVFF